MDETAMDQEDQFPKITELKKAHRRVLGVMIEKAFTTPEYYPLTLKALTAGANQKSNRAPITSYSEDAVLESLDRMRELGLVAVVHTESGRTERFRHYMRRRFTFSEPQLAILTELLLRGRQSLGELRSRSSRMVPIESLDQLRTELTGLTEMGYVQANGSLDRRGVEVDHNLYLANEGRTLTLDSSNDDSTGVSSRQPSTANAPTELVDQMRDLQATVDTQQSEIRQLREDLDRLKSQFEEYL